MTDPEDKTGRHSWASKIPLLTLLAVVFAAGGLVVDGKVTRNRVEELHHDLREAVKEQKATNAAFDARIRSSEEYRLTHEAATSPLKTFVEDMMRRRK